MIGGDQFVGLLGQDGECGALVAFVFRLLPDAREHEQFAVLAVEIIRLFAPFIPPFIEAVGGNDTTLLLEMRPELPFSHSIGARIQQRRTRLSVWTVAMNAEPREHNAIPRDKHRDSLCRRDIRIKLKVHARPAVKLTRDLGPFVDRTETIAHTVKVGSSQYVSSETAPKRPCGVAL